MKSTRHWVLAAILSPAALLAAAGAAQEPQRIPGSEIADTFRGVTLVGTYNDGQDTRYRETYNPDGTIDYHDDDNGDLKGAWGVTNSTFCTYYDGIQGTCFQVSFSGANCFFFTAVSPSDRPPLPNDWTARGWKEGAPSTCDN